MHLQRLHAAFPPRVTPNVTEVYGSLSDLNLLHPATDINNIVVENAVVTIPCRIYFLPSKQLLNPEHGETDRLVLACLLSRHSSGYTREASVATLMESTREWTLPFVVQLLSEYVVEISSEIEKATLALPKSVVAEFAENNSEYLATTARRAVSYWNVNYRHIYPRFSDYPAYRALKAMGCWNHTVARRIKKTD